MVRLPLGFGRTRLAVGTGWFAALLVGAATAVALNGGLAPAAASWPLPAAAPAPPPVPRLAPPSSAAPAAVPATGQALGPGSVPLLWAGTRPSGRAASASAHQGAGGHPNPGSRRDLGLPAGLAAILLAGTGSAYLRVLRAGPVEERPVPSSRRRTVPG